MAVAAAIGVGGLDDGRSLPNNITETNRIGNRLRNKRADFETAPGKMGADPCAGVCLELGEPSSAGNQIIGEINRSIEKMSLNMMEDARTATGTAASNTNALPIRANKETTPEEQKTANAASLLLTPLQTNNTATCKSSVNRRGSNWTTVSTEGYGSLCGSEQVSTATSRRASDLSISSYSQVIVATNICFTSFWHL